MADTAAEGALEHETLPMPELDYRWVHTGSQYLDLLPTPITTAATIYKPFSPDESRRIQEAWDAFTPEERQKAIHDWGRKEGEGFATPATKGKDKDKEKDKEKERRGSNASGKSGRDGEEVIRSGEEQPHDDEKDGDGKYKDFLAAAQQEYENLELIAGVPVSQDSLFEVSLKSLSLHPAFWAHAGPRVSVLKGSWFVTDETKPCSWDFAEELEKGYKEIEPWQPSYKHELATAIALGSAAEEKLKYTLPARFGSLGVIFEDADKARLLTTGALNYLPRQFFSLRGRASGTLLYRGYSAAAAANPKSSGHSRSGSTSTSRRPSSNIPRPDKPEAPTGARARSASVFEDLKEGADKLKEGADKLKEGADRLKEGADKLGKEGIDRLSGKKKAALHEEMAPLVDSDESDVPCTDLILVIHGIGQQLAAQYEAYNFVYASNQLRQCLRTQAANPALSSIIRDRRVQVLPVQWRALLTFEHEQSEEDAKHDMDNRFTMGDITLNKSIPYVRELTNSVLLDIPLFMSPHRQKMIEAVCLQANKLYRLWVARNPDFDKNGRVHIIGHSLGSALAAHILSNQPTKMPSLDQLPKQVITKTRDRFIFNTSNLFLCGSPLGIFLHLDQAQLMPRKARERTMNSPQDEALDRAGKFGCMSIDSLYNVFYPTDPIAYMLNAAVDSKLAAQRQPLAITSVTAGFYATVSEGFGTISRYMPSIPYITGTNGTPEKKASRPGAIRLPSGIEMSGSKGQEKLEGSRGERRFSALNPHGNIDFYLTAAGVNEYLDMITAHASYWTDASFAAFLLAETFSTRLDLVRTGMGLAQQVLPEGTTL